MARRACEFNLYVLRFILQCACWLRIGTQTILYSFEIPIKIVYCSGNLQSLVPRIFPSLLFWDVCLPPPLQSIFYGSMCVKSVHSSRAMIIVWWLIRLREKSLGGQLYLHILWNRTFTQNVNLKIFARVNNVNHKFCSKNGAQRKKKIAKCVYTF